jgi:hypothetical protein
LNLFLLSLIKEAMKKMLILLSVVALFAVSCGENDNENQESNGSNSNDDDLFLPFENDTMKTQDSVYIVNTTDDLAQHGSVTWNSMYVPFTFDLNTETLFILYSQHNYGVNDVTSDISIFWSIPEQCDWTVYVHTNAAAVITPYIYIKKIGKISSNAVVQLDKGIVY